MVKFQIRHTHPWHAFLTLTIPIRDISLENFLKLYFSVFVFKSFVKLLGSFSNRFNRCNLKLMNYWIDSTSQLISISIHSSTRYSQYGAKLTRLFLSFIAVKMNSSCLCFFIHSIFITTSYLQADIWMVFSYHFYP